MQRVHIRLSRRALLASGLVLGAGLLATALALAAYQGKLFRFLELDSVDARFAIRGNQTPPADLVLVQIDDATFNDLGVQWPFPRSLHARVIRRISADRPQVIAYDVQFTEQSTPREDDALIRAVANADGKVVLATAEVDAAGHANIFGGDDILRKIHARAGNSTIRPDPGGVLRRMPYEVGGLKNFAVVAAETASGHTIKPSALGGSSAWIDYYGPAGTIPAVSFSRLLRGHVTPGFFAGKVVVVGASATSLQDVHATSTSGDELMSGPEIEANAIATASRGFPLRNAPGAIDVALIFALGLIVPVANLRFRLAFALLIGAGAGVSFAGGTQLAFNSGRVLTFIYPTGGLVLSCVALLGARYAIAIFDARLGARRGAQALQPGAAFAGHRIERMLGRGGGGTVYLATEDALRRRVALKVLNPEFAKDAEFRDRFLHESQIAAALDHPNVVPVYRAGEEDGTLYITMKYVRGSLAALIRRDDRLDFGRTLVVVEQVADALDAAHAVGLVHRDVSPSNVLLEPRTTADSLEHAYLADFGLAFHQGLVSQTERVGKPDYVAPEQIRGEGVDGRADQYSLGCILYECLTGETPFGSASEINVIGAHLSKPPPAVTALRPELPMSIDAVIAKALAKQPEERFATCGELAAAVRAAQRGSLDTSASR